MFFDAIFDMFDSEIFDCSIFDCEDQIGQRRRMQEYYEDMKVRKLKKDDEEILLISRMFMKIIGRV